MYKEAIKKNSQWTKPIYFVSRYFDSEIIYPSIATMIILNEDGWALTCKHVVNQWLNGNVVNDKYNDYKKEIKNKNEKRKLIKKYNYNADSLVEQVTLFISVFDNSEIEKIVIHNELDLAMIKWKNFTHINISDFPVFTSKNIIPGQSICKLGYPFPEYSCFKYDKKKDKIVIDDIGNFVTPLFPLDGMITRKIAINNKIVAFETSTPGLKGQSGGPVFDFNGKLLGIQSMTAHLDLMFDIDSEVTRGNRTRHVMENQFLNVGICIDSNQIMRFLDDNNIKYYKED